MIETIEEVHERAVGLAEMRLPRGERLDAMLVNLCNGLLTRNTHLHLLGGGLVKNIQKAQVELVAVMTHLLLEFLKCAKRMRFNTGVEFPPEVGGTNTLANLTLLKKLDRVRERLCQILLCQAEFCGVLLHQCRISPLFHNPRNFPTMTHRLYNSVRVTGHTHIDNASKLRIGHTDFYIKEALTPEEFNF